MRHICHDISEDVYIAENLRRNHEHLKLRKNIYQEMNADQDEQNYVAVSLKKAKNFAALAVDSIHHPPAIQRRQRNQIEDTKADRIREHQSRQHLQKIIDRLPRQIYITKEQKINRIEKKGRQVIHCDARYRRKSQSPLVMRKVIRIDRHRFRPSEAGKRKHQ